MAYTSIPRTSYNEKAEMDILQLLAFVVGFVQQNIYVTLWLGLAGATLAFLVVVPPFPFYNRSPEKWLQEGSGFAGSGIEIDGKKIN